MKDTFKLILYLLCIILTVSVIPVTASAAAVNGIGVSSDTVSPGGSFTVTITVPPLENADTASIRVSFDSSAFEVVSWEPSIANSLSNSGDGFFVLTSANASRVIELGGGLTLTAQMSAKAGAPEGTYTFTLSDHSFSYVADNGYDSVELWFPEIASANITVGSKQPEQADQQTENSSDDKPASVTSTTTAPVQTPETSSTAVTARTTSRTGSDDEAAGDIYNYDENDYENEIPEDSEPDPDGDTTSLPYTDDNDSPAVTTSGDSAAPARTSREDTESLADGGENTRSGNTAGSAAASSGATPEVTGVPDEAAGGDTTRPAAVRNNDSDIILRSGLSGLTQGQVKASTKREYFYGNTEIRFSNSDSADKNAAAALKSSGLEGHGYYAFDISLYDLDSGSAIHSLPEGYIEFSVPVPKNLAGRGGDLSVYHIANGAAQLVTGGAASENGQYYVRFRAAEFSTYVIVDMSDSGGAAAVQPSRPSQASTAAQSYPAASGGVPRNPNTGVTAAIAIPSVLIVCSVLSKKGRNRRKRTKKSIE